MGERGAIGHRKEVAVLVAEMDTMDLLVVHAMEILGPLLSDPLPEELTQEGRICLQGHLMQLQLLCGCIFAAPEAFSSQSVVNHAEVYSIRVSSCMCDLRCALGCAT